MNGSRMLASLRKLGEVVSGRATPDVRKNVQEQLANTNSHLAIFIQGLRELPTSILDCALSSEIGESLQMSNETTLADEQVMRDSIQMVARPLLSQDNPPSDMENRRLVDQAYQTYFGLRSAGVEERRAFFEIAGRGLADLLVERARREIEKGGHYESEDTTIAFEFESTIDASVSHPRWILARDDALQRLEAADEHLARMYLLAVIAGRSPPEIAELLDIPVEMVCDAVEVATIEVAAND